MTFLKDFIEDFIESFATFIKSDEINQKSKKYAMYETDIRLLKRLLMGPKYAHWNNAEIGSHLKFFRKPNIFERDIYNSFLFFHS